MGFAASCFDELPLTALDVVHTAGDGRTPWSHVRLGERGGDGACLSHRYGRVGGDASLMLREEQV